MNDDTNPNVTRDPGVLPEITEEREVTAAPVETVPSIPPKQRLRKPVIAAIIAAIIVVLAGVGVLGYTMWYQNPDKVVHDAVLNMIKAESMSSTGAITYRDEDLSLDIRLDGDFGESSGELSVAATMTVDTDEMKQDFKAEGVGRFVDDTLYIKLSGIEAIVEDVTAESGGQIPAYASSIYEKIDDKWISIKASDYQDIDESVAKQQECVTNLIEKTQTDDQLSGEVMGLYKKNQIIIIEEELGSKNVNGTDSLGYGVSLNQSAAKSFVEGIGGTNFGKELKECDDSIDFNEIAKDLAGDDSKDEDLPKTEIWVSRISHEFTEISVRGDSEEENESVNITLLPTFNKEVNVEAPSDATSFKVILEEIQQAILEYYSEVYSPAGGTMPEGSGSGIDAELLPAV